MSKVLIEKMRAARQTRVEVDGFTFVCRRPTRREAEDMRSNDFDAWQILDKFVIGWDGVREIDLVPGGSPVAVEFTPELCAEWIADCPQMWEPLANAVVKEYEAYAERIINAEKK